MAKKEAFRYNTGATKVPWAAVGENYNAEDLYEVVKFMMQGEGPEYEAALEAVKCLSANGDDRLKFRISSELAA